MSTKSRKRKQVKNKKKKYSFELSLLGSLGFAKTLRKWLFRKKKRSTIRGRIFREELKIYASYDLENKITIPLSIEYNQ